MLKIKLSLRGRKHQLAYRIIVVEAKSKRDGNFTDDLGYYNPSEQKLEFNESAAKKWIASGAQVTEGVKKILIKNNIQL